MKTREKILLTALDLFNSQGVNKVTVRDISNALEISPGNFSYHFPNKEVIVNELYDRLAQETHASLEQVPFAPNQVAFFLEVHKRIFLIQHKYRFFYLNLFHIMTHHPQVRAKFVQQVIAEKQMARQFIDLYKQEGIFTESLHADHIERLINVGHVLNNSWMIDAEIHFSGSMKEKMLHYMQLCCGRIVPYLSPNAQEAYKDYFQKLAA